MRFPGMCGTPIKCSFVQSMPTEPCFARPSLSFPTRYLPTTLRCVHHEVSPGLTSVASSACSSLSSLCLPPQGDAWQYQWWVPGHPEDLVGLFPSTKEYVSRLNYFFNESLTWPLGTFMPNPYYWAGERRLIFVYLRCVSFFLFGFPGRLLATTSPLWFVPPLWLRRQRT